MFYASQTYQQNILLKYIAKILPYSKTTQHNALAEIDCVMWNCSGVLPTDSTEEKVHFLETITNNKCDILVLIETHHKNEEDITPLLHRYKNTHHMTHTTMVAEETNSDLI